jgi:CheY-like chemotaxis protein
MDLQMPIMDGISAARTIRSSQGEPFDTALPIIALTAFSSSEDRKLTFEAGMNHHIAKPIDFDDLLEVVEDCLEHPE